MKSQLKFLGAAAAATGLLVMGGIPSAAQAPSQTGAGIEYEVDLDTLNQSFDMGTADVTVRGRQVTVSISAIGLDPGLPHAQHMHIGGENVCPPPSADTDGDGFVDTVEGQPFYGGVQVSLTTEGDVSAASALAVDRFPVADPSNGDLEYERTFQLPDGVTSAAVADAVIVQHGIDINTNADYDGAKPSPLDANLPFEATVPATCGELQPAGATPGQGSQNAGLFGFLNDLLTGLFG